MATASQRNDMGNDGEIARAKSLLAAQRETFIACAPEPLSIRKDRIDRCIALLVEHADPLADAMSADFGHRSREQSLLADVMGPIGSLKHARKHMAKWSRTERRPAMFPLGLLGAKAELRYQPKGVVGVVAPWNFPVAMVMVPMAGILAAGNRALIKPSEFTERTSALLADLIPRYFADEEMAVVTGGADVGQAFCALPFDHLIFTGATGIGRHVMRAAADNLVPLTLELGGKSPTIISRSANLERAGSRIATGKMMNAGQICLAPDYLLVPEEARRDVIDAVTNGVAAQYPTLLANDDYSSVINDRNFERLQGLIADARDKGAEVIEVNPANEDFANSNGRKMPLHIVTGVTEDMRVMQEEIFGPVLPVMTYRKVEEAIDYVNAHDRPLGLYWFGEDGREREQVLTRTISGGVTVNDVVFHNAIEDLPFGGVGPSGMGAYHGIEGFKSFSHARAVYHQPRIDVGKLSGFKPPYGKATLATLKRMLKK